MNRTIKFIISAAIVAAPGAMVTEGQTGGAYTITQSVIGSGGTSVDVGNVYKIESTLGQPIAGTTSSSSNYSVKGGFWTPILAPTAASVTIGGRVVIEGASGKGIQNVLVTVTDQNGTTRSVLTGAGGKYRFDNLEAGQTYIFTVSAKRYAFNQSSIVHSATDNFDELNFSGARQF